MIAELIIMIGVWCLIYSIIIILQTKKHASKPPPKLLKDLEAEYRKAHPDYLSGYRFVTQDEVKNYWNEQK